MSPVIGVSDDRRRNVLHKIFEHERAGADGMMPVPGIAVLFDYFRVFDAQRSADFLQGIQD